MRRAGLALAALALASTAACATAPASGPVADASAPQPLADHDWFFEVEDDVAHLAYGRDESDDVWLAFSCLPGSGALNIAQYLKPDGTARIALEAGGDTETWPARRLPDDLNDGTYLSTQASASEPVFQQFRRTGWIASYSPDWRAPMAAHPGSTVRIERFFAVCG